MVFRSRCYIIYDKYSSRKGRLVLKGYIIPSKTFFSSRSPELANRLIGCVLWKRETDGILAGEIVETEAYTEDDPASHSFSGETRRNRPMFRRGGIAYVYMIYGIHYCFNVVSGRKGLGEAVLVRSLRPLKGMQIMKKRRNKGNFHELCSGPGKICQAMDINLTDNGDSLIEGNLRILVPEDEDESYDVEVTPRIGITKGAELLRRFVLRDSPWISG